MTSPLNLPAPGRCQAVYVVFKLCTALCFVKQLPGPILCARPGRTGPLFRSYGVNLPSSLTVNLSSALVSSTRPPVSVLRYGPDRYILSGFSWEPGYLRYRRSPGGLPYCRVSAQGVYFTAPLNTYTLQRTIPSVRGSVTSPSPHRYLSG